MFVQKMMCGIICMLTLSFSWQAAKSAENNEGKPQFKTEIYSNDFSAKKLGKEWKSYKSISKIEDGVLVGLQPEGGDHAAVEAVLTQSYGNVEVAVDFKFEGSKSFNLAFNEHKFKGSHAGHICRVVVRQNKVILRDGKTGVFSNEVFNRKKAGKLDAKTKTMLKTKERIINVKFEKGTWYHLFVRIKGDKMTLLVDGKKLGEFQSPGIAHPTKNKLALVTPKQAMHFDNLKILAP